MRVRKKVLVCTLFMILISSLIIGGLYLYSQDNKTPTLKDNSSKITNTNVEEQKQENIIEETNKKDDVVTSDTINQNVVKEENKSSSSNNSSTPIIDNNNNKVEDKQINDSEVEENQNKDDVSNEDTNDNQNNTSENNSNGNTTIYEFEFPEPVVDEEYLAILEYVDYTSEEYSLCNIDSTELAFSDTENIEHTACKEFTYKGSRVGYKIQIYYRDGRIEFYDKNS